MSAESYQLSWVTPALAVGSAPMSHEDLDSLKRQGVDAILNLCAEYCDLHWIEADAGFETYYLPIPDEETPDLEALEKALDWLDEVLYLGKKALIHCRHGIGRTGTVLNAYLLRKGLGSRVVERTLKPLRSKPSNFSQWWFIRKYRHKQRPLTVREPSLEAGEAVDLAPFLAELEQLLEEVDMALHKGREGNIGALCGHGHDRCCRDLVCVSLVEAVYIRHSINGLVEKTTRERLVPLALAALKEQQAAQRETRHETGPALPDPSLALAYRSRDVLCPLNEFGECLIFDHRPLACRLADLSLAKREQMEEDLRQRAASISARLFAALSGAEGQERETAESFSLAEVVSGRFVSAFFHRLAAQSG
jgi:protein-tyrosine phosphatase/Fe-S-cluster containining protein